MLSKLCYAKIIITFLFLLFIRSAFCNVFANDNELAGELLQGKSPHLQFGLPSEPDLLLSRIGFAIGYSNKYRQPQWVSYVLYRDKLSGKKYKRHNKFEVDPAVLLNPVIPIDYTDTGFDRGHMAPAADMSFSLKTLRHSFFMSNISPQMPGCNRGIWKRLENRIRWYVLRHNDIYIVTGPIFYAEPERLEKSKIPIPAAFYKILFDFKSFRMIGFIISNSPSKKTLKKFAVPVDEIEKQTGLDFFSELSPYLEYYLEKKINYNMWFPEEK